MTSDSPDGSVDTYPIAAKLSETREFFSKHGGISGTSDPSMNCEVPPMAVGRSVHRGRRAAISNHTFNRRSVGFIAVERDVEESRQRRRNQESLLDIELVTACDGSSSGHSIPVVVANSFFSVASKKSSS
jgi:hypothetical protein